MGSSNTRAAIEKGGKPFVVKFGAESTFPTVACVLPDGTIKVGREAEALRHIHPESFKQEFKLHIGEEIEINSANYDDIVAEMLSYVRQCAEKESGGEEISYAVLTYPAHYTEADRRKEVMRKGAAKAGFLKVEFLSEPEAAAGHYRHICGKEDSGIYLVYDLGGSTFNASLVESTSEKIRIIGIDRGLHSGGHFFDKAVYNYIASKAREEGMPLDRLRRFDDYAASRYLKENISEKESATRLFSTGNQILDRETFNSLIKSSVSDTLQICDTLLSNAGKTWKDLNSVLLAGGSSSLPLIEEMLCRHALSHDAPDLKVISDLQGPNGSYDIRFATCLGGIAGKIPSAPLPPKKPGRMIAGEREYQLKQGPNTFGRDDCMDCQFDDPSMSRHHFTITVSEEPEGDLRYILETKSSRKATIINGREALDLRFAPISRVSVELKGGDIIDAGKTKLVFEI